MMDDLIRRHEAIDAAKHAWAKGLEPSQYLEELPSASPDLSGYSDKLWKAAYERGKAEALAEREKGRWEYVDYGGFGNYHCSACRTICICNGDYDFCPNCGADMRGEQDEVD